MVTASFFAWKKFYFNMSVLFFAATQSVKSSFCLALFCYGLAVGYLRFSDISGHLKFANESISNYFQVKLTHTGNNRLPSVLAQGHSEAWVLLSYFFQTFNKQFFICLGLGLYGNTNDRFRKLHCFENNEVVDFAECIASSSKFQSSNSPDVTSANR